jgi:hypothetical protein
MTNRLEYKFLAPIAYMDRLRTDLLRYLDPDEYAAVRPGYEYTVRSIYLDTRDFRCYHEKMDGVRIRRKFRIRGYNEWSPGAPVFFEIKRKHDNFISKSRARVILADVPHVLTDRQVDPSATEGGMGSDFESFYHHYLLHQLEPKALTVYDREAYECKFGSRLRITFDKNLRTKSVAHALQVFDNDGLSVIHRREFVLEVKFFQVLPQWIKGVLEKYDLTRGAVSKYALSIQRNSNSFHAWNGSSHDVRHQLSAA